MQNPLSLTKTSSTGIKLSLISVIGMVVTLLSSIPAKAHHPFDLKAIETFSSIEGLLSGLVHPITGLDHFLFLLSIGLIGTLSFKRWVPILLFFGFLGSLFSYALPILIPGVEILMGLTLLGSALVSIKKINPLIMIPLITCHGYVLGQSMLGSEPTPLIAYLIGLLISEAIVIYTGIILFHRFSQYKNMFALCLVMTGIVMTFGLVLA